MLPYPIRPGFVLKNSFHRFTFIANHVDKPFFAYCKLLKMCALQLCQRVNMGGKKGGGWLVNMGQFLGFDVDSMLTLLIY